MDSACMIAAHINLVQSWKVSLRFAWNVSVGEVCVLHSDNI